VSGKKSLLENITSFNEAITHPVKLKDGYFVTPWEAGYSVEYKADFMQKYEFPNGKFWTSGQGMKIRNGPKR
jgi:L-galactonate dehydratase